MICEASFFDLLVLKESFENGFCGILGDDFVPLDLILVLLGFTFMNAALDIDVMFDDLPACLALLTEEELLWLPLDEVDGSCSPHLCDLASLCVGQND